MILFDSVQISSGKSYTSRVKILVNGKEQWLSLPVKKAGNFGQKICETELLDFKINWRKNLGTLKQAYAKTPFFKEVYPLLESYLPEEHQYLSKFNTDLIKKITKALGREDIVFLNASDKPELMASDSLRTDYIIDTCKAFGVKNYLTGRGSSLTFLEEEKFKECGINLSYQDFKHPVYKQPGTDTFVPGLSIIDTLMNLGFEQTSKILHEKEL